MDGFVSNECRRRRFLLADDIAAAAATPIGPSHKYILIIKKNHTKIHEFLVGHFE